jgi:hypothetical protein
MGDRPGPMSGVGCVQPRAVARTFPSTIRITGVRSMIICFENPCSDSGPLRGCTRWASSLMDELLNDLTMPSGALQPRPNLSD